ncbi:MAG TPA: hypothetical protein VF484_06110 [Candidatus Limnocylindrales bacterium]
MRIAGATVTVLAGIAGLIALFVPYVSYSDGPPFSLIPLDSIGVVGDSPDGQSLAFALEPLGVAVALIVVGVAAFAARSRLVAGLAIGLGVGLALNHGSFWMSLSDPNFEQHAAAGLYVGLAAGAAALIGGLFLALDRPATPDHPAA